MTSDSLPHSAEAERAILGAILLNGSLIAQAMIQLQPTDFYIPSHRYVYEAMLVLTETQRELDPVLIGEELKRDGHLQSAGGYLFITGLTYGLPHTNDISHYVRVVRGKSMLRRLKQTVAKIEGMVDAEDGGPEEILAQAVDEVFNLSIEARLEAKASARSYKDVAVKVSETFQQWETGQMVAVPTQIPEVDDNLRYGGFAAGDLVVIAARTSFGKTALALQIALSAARAGTQILIFSLEMSAENLFMRNLATESGVPHWRISPKTFQFNPGLASMIRGSLPQIAKLPITVDHQTRKLRRLSGVSREWRKRTKGKALIVTDYMQLVDNKLDRRSRNDEVAGISIELKGLANELELPIIGVSQLTRSPAKDNRRPELPDLRESGQLEQDADVVLFPWSQDGIKDDQIRSMLLYCAKQRGGRVGWEIPIDFDGDKQWFFTGRMYAEMRGEVARQIDFNEE